MAALRSLEPEDHAELERELSKAREDLIYLRGQRASHASIVEKLDGSIAANERAIERFQRQLEEATT